MLTASHMPYQNNGMKFFTAEGGLAKPDITQILTTAAEKAAAAGVELGDDMQVGINLGYGDLGLGTWLVVLSWQLVYG